MHPIVLSAIFVSVCACTSVHTKLGETLPQLVQRFGKNYRVQGAEETNDLRYTFQLKGYAVDAGMVRAGGELVSTLEAYYSEQPLQENGEPPVAIVRGIMAVTAPKAKWIDAKPVGSQRAAFVTADGTCEATILPPAKSDYPNSTFTVVVARLKAISAGSSTNQPKDEQPANSPPPAIAPALSEDDVHSPESLAPAPTPVMRIHVNGSFMKVLKGKSPAEVQATIGPPFHRDGDTYTWLSMAPGFFGELDGWLVINFHHQKATVISVVTHTQPDPTFVRLALQSTPDARFVPYYRAENLTGSNWRDEAQSFAAATYLQSENEYWFTIDVTPWEERFKTTAKH